MRPAINFQPKVLRSHRQNFPPTKLMTIPIISKSIIHPTKGIIPKKQSRQTVAIAPKSHIANLPKVRSTNFAHRSILSKTDFMNTSFCVARTIRATPKKLTSLLSARRPRLDLVAFVVVADDTVQCDSHRLVHGVSDVVEKIAGFS